MLLVNTTIVMVKNNPHEARDEHNPDNAGGEHNPDDAGDQHDPGDGEHNAGDTDGDVIRGEDSRHLQCSSQHMWKKMRIATDLTEREENFMVEWLKEHPVLYNKKLKDYRNKSKKVQLLPLILLSNSPATYHSVTETSRPWAQSSCTNLLKMTTTHHYPTNSST